MRNSGFNLNVARITTRDDGISVKFKFNLVNHAFSNSPSISALSDRGSFSQLGFFHRWDFLHQSQPSQIGEVFSQLKFSWDFVWIGIFSTDHGALRSGEFFSVVSFSQVGFPPLISVLSDRGSVFWPSQIGGCLRLPDLPDRGNVFTIGTFHSWDILHQSQRSQMGGVFSQLGLPPLISAGSDWGSIFTAGIFSLVFSGWEFFLLGVGP